LIAIYKQGIRSSQRKKRFWWFKKASSNSKLQFKIFPSTPWILI